MRNDLVLFVSWSLSAMSPKALWGEMSSKVGSLKARLSSDRKGREGLLQSSSASPAPHSSPSARASASAPVSSIPRLSTSPPVLSKWEALVESIMPHDGYEEAEPSRWQLG